MEICHHRSALSRTLRQIKTGSITVGFVGGSITDGRVPYNWPEPVTAWFVGHYPSLRVQVENAAIGATGSDLAVFRAKRDLIDRGCDLVFVEFAVNDSGEPSEKRRQSREGLLRKLMSGEGRDLVIVYTFGQDMYEDMVAGRVPCSIAEFEDLAEYYGIGSVWMGLNALNEVKAGYMRWEEWLPDGLHPQYRGSLSYAQSVGRFLDQELNGKERQMPLKSESGMPPPMDPLNWEGSDLIAFEMVRLNGPWTIRRCLSMPWMDQVLDTAAPGSRLSFDYDGRGVALGFDFGRLSSEFRYRVDGGEWVDVNRDRPDWCGPEGWFRLTCIGADIQPGRHTMEIEVTRGLGPNCTGSNFRLGLIGIIR